MTAVLAAVGILFAAIAFGDQLRNNAVSSSASGIGGNLKVTLGANGLGKVNVGYWVEDLGGDGCSVSAGEPADVTINLAEGVTASPADFELINCVPRRGTGRQNVEFCFEGPGIYSLPNALVSGGNGQTLTSQTTAFKVTATGAAVDGASCSGDGGTDPDEIENTAPVVGTPAEDVSEDEGTEMTMDGGFTDADEDDLTLTAVDENDNEIDEDDGFVDNGDGTWDWSLTKLDDYSGKVSVSADDGNGGSTADSFDWESTNVAPEIDSESVEISGSDCRPTVEFDISDPGTKDTWAHALDFNGPVDVLATLAAPFTDDLSRSVTKSSVYSSTGSQTISLGVEDDDGGQDSQDLTHSVPNTVAEARFGPPVQLDGNGKGLFKAGSTIPVKVRAGACEFESDGSYTPVNGASLKVLTLTYVSSDTTGVPVTAATNVKADVGGWMRPSENQYIYNLVTPKTAKGTYRLAIEGFTSRTSGVSTGEVAFKNIVIR